MIKMLTGAEGVIEGQIRTKDTLADIEQMTLDGSEQIGQKENHLNQTPSVEELLHNAENQETVQSVDRAMKTIDKYSANLDDATKMQVSTQMRTAADVLWPVSKNISTSDSVNNIETHSSENAENVQKITNILLEKNEDLSKAIIETARDVGEEVGEINPDSIENDIIERTRVENKTKYQSLTSNLDQAVEILTRTSYNELNFINPYKITDSFNNLSRFLNNHTVPKLTIEEEEGFYQVLDSCVSAVHLEDGVDISQGIDLESFKDSLTKLHFGLEEFSSEFLKLASNIVNDNHDKKTENYLGLIIQSIELTKEKTFSLHSRVSD